MLKRHLFCAVHVWSQACLGARRCLPSAFSSPLSEVQQPPRAHLKQTKNQQKSHKYQTWDGCGISVGFWWDLQGFRSLAGGPRKASSGPSSGPGGPSPGPTPSSPGTSAMPPKRKAAGSQAVPEGEGAVTKSGKARSRIFHPDPDFRWFSKFPMCCAGQYFRNLLNHLKLWVWVEFPSPSKVEQGFEEGAEANVPNKSRTQMERGRRSKST